MFYIRGWFTIVFTFKHVIVVRSSSRKGINNSSKVRTEIIENKIQKIIMKNYSLKKRKIEIKENNCQLRLQSASLREKTS